MWYRKENDLKCSYREVVESEGVFQIILTSHISRCKINLKMSWDGIGDISGNEEPDGFILPIALLQ